MELISRSRKMAVIFRNAHEFGTVITDWEVEAERAEAERADAEKERAETEKLEAERAEADARIAEERIDEVARREHTSELDEERQKSDKSKEIKSPTSSSSSLNRSSKHSTNSSPTNRPPLSRAAAPPPPAHPPLPPPSSESPQLRRFRCHLAARRIQRAWRLFQRRRYLEYFRELQDAAVVLQTAWRRYAAGKRRRGVEASAALKEASVKEAVAKQVAAVKIQAAWRGFEVRKRLERALEYVRRCEEEENEEEDEFGEVTLEGWGMEEDEEEEEEKEEAAFTRTKERNKQNETKGVTLWHPKEAWNNQQMMMKAQQMTGSGLGFQAGSALSRASSVDTQAREASSAVAVTTRETASVDSHARGITPSSSRIDSRMEKKQVSDKL